MKAARIVGFQESEERINEIDKVAEANGYSRSDFIRNALHEKLEKLRQTAEQLRPEPARANSA